MEATDAAQMLEAPPAQPTEPATPAPAAAAAAPAHTPAVPAPAPVRRPLTDKQRAALDAGRIKRTEALRIGKSVMAQQGLVSEPSDGTTDSPEAMAKPPPEQTPPLASSHLPPLAAKPAKKQRAKTYIRIKGSDSSDTSDSDDSARGRSTIVIRTGRRKRKSGAAQPATAAPPPQQSAEHARRAPVPVPEEAYGDSDDDYYDSPYAQLPMVGTMMPGGRLFVPGAAYQNHAHHTSDRFTQRFS